MSSQRTPQGNLVRLIPTALLGGLLLLLRPART